MKTITYYQLKEIKEGFNNRFHTKAYAEACCHGDQKAKAFAVNGLWQVAIYKRRIWEE